MNPLVLRDSTPDPRPLMTYLARLGSSSRRTQAGALDIVARWFGVPDAHAVVWHQMRYTHAMFVRARAEECYAPKTANRVLSAVRGIAHECRKLGLMPAEAYEAIREIRGVRGDSKRKGRALNANELWRLFVNCDVDDTTTGLRDAALLAVLYGIGLRRAEAAALCWKQVHDGKGHDLRRKGGKFVTSQLPEWAARRLERWARTVGRETPTVFGMAPSTIWDALDARCKRAGIAHASPHDLRRTFATMHQEKGTDLGALQELMGHKNVETTIIYDLSKERRAAEAAARLPDPTGDGK